MWFGVLAMAYSLLVNSLVSQIINSYPNKKLLNYGYIEQLKDILPSITLAVFMGGVISIFNCIDCSDIIMLLLQVTVGSVIYIVGSIIFKMDSFNYLLEIVRNLIKR